VRSDAEPTVHAHPDLSAHTRGAMSTVNGATTIRGLYIRLPMVEMSAVKNQRPVDLAARHP